MSHSLVRRNVLRLLGVSTLLLVGLPMSAASRQTPPQAVPRFKTGVEGVLVDVSVLDRDRRPVRGLTAADFTVLEDGVQQAIRTFTEVDIPEVTEPSSWLREVGSDVRRNDDSADRRIVVLVLDDATPMPAADVQRTRKLARSVIDQLGADDLVAVVYCLNKKAGQEFTSDRARLLTAVEKFNGSIDGMKEMGGKIDSEAKPVPYSSFGLGYAGTLFQSTVNTLTGVAEYLSDLPHRRKALILVSVGLPLDSSKAPAPIDVSEAAMDTKGIVGGLITGLEATLSAAQRSNVSVYGLDPGGLRVEGGTQGGALNRDFLSGLAANTGGFAIVNTNDPAPGIAQIVRENSSYYLLGYQSTNSRRAGWFHRIHVRVTRPGVTVRARSGYFEMPPPKEAAPPSDAVRSDAALLQAISMVAPKADVAMQMTAAPFANPGRQEGALAITVRITLPAPPGVERVGETVRLRVNAYDPLARLRGKEQLDARLALRPTPAGEATYEVLSRLDLKPGRYQIRVAADSALRQKTGSVFYDVDVPDFSKGRLALSGLTLSAIPGVSVASHPALKALLPVLPTAQREFGSNEQVSGFVRVYQPGKTGLKSVDVSVTVLDLEGRKVVDRGLTLPTERFTTQRAADCPFVVPVAMLPRGHYLLQVSAALGDASVRRQVRFRVK